MSHDVNLRTARVLERFNKEVDTMDPMKASLLAAVLEKLKTDVTFDAPQVAICISTTRDIHNAIETASDTIPESTGESSALREMMKRGSAESHPQCSAFEDLKPFKA